METITRCGGMAMQFIWECWWEPSASAEGSNATALHKDLDFNHAPYGQPRKSRAKAHA
jgi:hypothetical protein